MKVPLRAVLDASVIYPVSLRNLLMRLTLNRLFQARWTQDIHDEWIGAVLRNRPNLSAAQLHRVRAAMDSRAGDAVVTDYNFMIRSLVLLDPNDRYVVAAAVVAGAEVIVTRNLRDFPAEVLDRFEIEAQHPDAFVRRLIQQDPAAVVDAVRAQQRQLVRPPLSMEDLLAIFDRLDLHETTAELRCLMD